MDVKCTICTNKYDLGERIPVTPSQCSHTLCKLCAEEILKSNNKTCPKCRGPFPRSSQFPKYSINQETKKKVEYNSKFEPCRRHDKPLDLYCETDQCKICYDCMFVDSVHKRHDVEHSDKLEPQISKRREAYEQGREKLNTLKHQVKELIGKRTSEHFEDLANIDRVTKLYILETSIHHKSILNEENKKFERQYGDKSEILTEIGQKIEQCQIQHPNLNLIFQHNVQDFNQRLENAISSGSIEEFKTQFNQVVNSLAKPQSASSQSGLAISFPPLLERIKTFSRKMRLKMTGDQIDITVPVRDARLRIESRYEIDLEAWKKYAKKIKVTFEHFELEKDDLQVMEYIFMRFQDQIQSVSLTYKNIRTHNVPHQNRFEDHIASFSRLVFSSIQTLHSLKLTFIRSNGSDRFIRALQEALLSGRSGLTSLNIHCDETDLTKETIANFFSSAGNNTLLKDLKDLYLVFNNASGYFHATDQLSLELPNLENFVFKANCYTRTMTNFLLSRQLLESMKEQLKKYEVHLGTKFLEDENYEEEEEEDEEEDEEGEESEEDEEYEECEEGPVVDDILNSLMEFKKIVSIKVDIPRETPNLDLETENFASPSTIRRVEINGNILINTNHSI